MTDYELLLRLKWGLDFIYRYEAPLDLDGICERADQWAKAVIDFQ